jgi:hypothetical protein
MKQLFSEMGGTAPASALAGSGPERTTTTNELPPWALEKLTQELEDLRAMPPDQAMACLHAIQADVIKEREAVAEGKAAQPDNKENALQRMQQQKKNEAASRGCLRDQLSYSSLYRGDSSHNHVPNVSKDRSVRAMRVEALKYQGVWAKGANLRKSTGLTPRGGAFRGGSVSSEGVSAGPSGSGSGSIDSWSSTKATRNGVKNQIMATLR